MESVPFIEGAKTYDLVENQEDFYQSAVAFGRFQGLLADYPAETLHETIQDFHNTVKRLDTFKKAVEADGCGRASTGAGRDSVCAGQRSTGAQAL